ncbi:MAG: LysR substrate-binding domain-containing protein [Pseudomonadota bacterium]
MQDLDWNDLRFVLAAARESGFAAAARRLGVDETTVARRVAAAERAIGAALFRRGPDGRRRPTEAGRAAAAEAARMEAAAEAAREAAGAARLRVRVSATPIIANRLIAPALASLLAERPDLAVELAAEPRNVDLALGEADLALRLARPATGGAAVKARRIGALPYGVFEAKGRRGPEAWVDYGGPAADLPQARWRAEKRPDAPVALRIADGETALEAVAAGLGHAALPLAVASRDARLSRVFAYGDPPSREVWLLTSAVGPPNEAVRATSATLRRLDWSGASVD